MNNLIRRAGIGDEMQVREDISKLTVEQAARNFTKLAEAKYLRGKQFEPYDLVDMKIYTDKFPDMHNFIVSRIAMKDFIMLAPNPEAKKEAATKLFMM